MRSVGWPTPCPVASSTARSATRSIPIPEAVLEALSARPGPRRPTRRPSEPGRAPRRPRPRGSGAGSGVDRRPAHVLACVGTKELVGVVAADARTSATRAATPCSIPAISYPTYAMGAELAGLRAVPVPLDDEWQLDLGRVSDDDAARALLLWTNDPGNPTAAVAARRRGRRPRSRGPASRGDRGRGRRVLRRVLRRRAHDVRCSRSRRRPRGALAVEAVEHGRLPCGLRRRRPRPRAATWARSASTRD